MDNSTHNEHFEGYKRRADVPEEENKRMRPPLRDRTNDANQHIRSTGYKEELNPAQLLALTKKRKHDDIAGQTSSQTFQTAGATSSVSSAGASCINLKQKDNNSGTDVQPSVPSSIKPDHSYLITTEQQSFDLHAQIAKKSHPSASASKTINSVFPLCTLARVVDIDAPYRDDLRFCNEYAAEIMNYLFQHQMKFRPMPSYMERQRDINHNMRSILVDWLVEVAEEYRLKPETLFLSVNYIDRFLSSMAVQRTKLQLVGVTCMLLASKYEEIQPPTVDNFVYITDETYRRDQVLRMEHIVLKVLRFDMGACTVLTFLDRFLLAASSMRPSQSLAKYLSEISILLGDRFMCYLPSVTAAAAVCLSQAMFGYPAWTSTFQSYCRLQPEQVQPCIEELFKAFILARTLAYQAIREKYSSHTFHKVAKLDPPSACPNIIEYTRRMSIDNT